MPQLRLALAQVNPTVGDLAGNAMLVRDWSRRAAQAGAQLVAFPELMLTGGPVGDLALRRSFVTASRNTLVRLATALAEDQLGELAIVVGLLDRADWAGVNAEAGDYTSPCNALALLHRGQVVCRYLTHHLPYHSDFGSDSGCVAGGEPTVARVGPPGEAVDVAFAVSEDLRRVGGTLAAARAAGVGLLICSNASPYHRDSRDVRLPMVANGATVAAATVAYVNLVGGQDDLVFDGDSMIVTADGQPLTRGPQLAEHLLVHDLELPNVQERASEGMLGETRVRPYDVPLTVPAPPGPAAAGGIAPPVSTAAATWGALVLGLRDYVNKNGFHSVTLGVSGGIDSAVVAAIAVDALGPQRVVGVSMPSQHSSQHSRQDAAELVNRTGIKHVLAPIQPMVDTFLANLSLSGLAVENLQARVRGVTLMALSNQDGHLVLTTSNRSELAVGYSTLYGDSVGGFSPLKDVPKTMVWQLARWRNEAAKHSEAPAPIPERTIAKQPSAELRPGQLDTDSLPPYEVLDVLLADYLDNCLDRHALIAAGHDPTTVDRVLAMIDGAEYKRRQSPPGPKIATTSYGHCRRLPITNRFRQS